MYYRRKILLSLLENFDGQLDKMSLQKLLFIYTRWQEKKAFDFKKDLNSFLSKYNDDEIMQNIIKEKMGFKYNLIN